MSEVVLEKSKDNDISSWTESTIDPKTYQKIMTLIKQFNQQLQTRNRKTDTSFLTDLLGFRLITHRKDRGVNERLYSSRVTEALILASKNIRPQRIKYQPKKLIDVPYCQYVVDSSDNDCTGTNNNLVVDDDTGSSTGTNNNMVVDTSDTGSCTDTDNIIGVDSDMGNGTGTNDIIVVDSSDTGNSTGTNIKNTNGLKHKSSCVNGCNNTSFQN